MADEIKRGDVVLYRGEPWKVRNVRTDRHNGPPRTTAKISRKNEIMFCVPVEWLKKVDN